MTAGQHIGDVVESIKPHFQAMQDQMLTDATLFRYGYISQQEYERRCCWRGCAPTDIEGFYKWDGGGTSGLPDWNAGKKDLTNG